MLVPTCGKCNRSKRSLPNETASNADAPGSSKTRYIKQAYDTRRLAWVKICHTMMTILRDWTGIRRVTQAMTSRPEPSGAPDTKCTMKPTRRSATSTTTTAATAKPLPFPVHSPHVNPKLGVYPSLQTEQSARGDGTASQNKADSRLIRPSTDCCVNKKMTYVRNLVDMCVPPRSSELFPRVSSQYSSYRVADLSNCLRRVWGHPALKIVEPIRTRRWMHDVKPVVFTKTISHAPL